MKSMLASLYAYDPFLSATMQHLKEEWDQIDDATKNEWRLAVIEITAEEIRTSIMSGILNTGAQYLILFIDSNYDSIQEATLQKIKDSIGKAIEIEIIRTSGKSASEIASEVINVIDHLPSEHRLLINISSLRHSKSLGLLYAASARNDRVDEIFYIEPGVNDFRQLVPKLSIRLSNKQIQVLRYLNEINNVDEEPEKKGRPKTLKYRLKNRLDMPRQTYYSCLKVLKRQGLVDKNNQLTEAGRVMIL